MRVRVTTRHINNNRDPEKLKSYAVKKSKRIEKYLKSGAEACDVNFVLSSEKFRDTAEISINSRSLKAASSFETTDMYTAIDSAVDVIIKQLKKETDKKKTSKRRNGAKNKEGALGAPANPESGIGKLYEYKGPQAARKAHDDRRSLLTAPRLRRELRHLPKQRQ